MLTSVRFNAKFVRIYCESRRAITRYGRKKRGKMLVTYVIDMAEKEREVGEVEGRSALPAEGGKS